MWLVGYWDTMLQVSTIETLLILWNRWWHLATLKFGFDFCKMGGVTDAKSTFLQQNRLVARALWCVHNTGCLSLSHMKQRLLRFVVYRWPWIIYIFCLFNKKPCEMLLSFLMYYMHWSSLVKPFASMQGPHRLCKNVYVNYYEKRQAMQSWMTAIYTLSVRKPQQLRIAYFILKSFLWRAQNIHSIYLYT